MKISEEIIVKHRNSLRIDIVRFPEELFMKNRDRLRDDFMRDAVEFQDNLKVTSAIISEE